jgi:hypothetical protein
MALSLAQVSDCYCFSEHDGHLKRQTAEQWYYHDQFKLKNFNYHSIWSQM